MGANLVAAKAMEENTPDLRHVRVAVAILFVGNDFSQAVRLLEVALSKPELIEPAIIDLGRATALGGSASKLAALVSEADKHKTLRNHVGRVLGNNPAAPGLADLVARLRLVSAT